MVMVNSSNIRNVEYDEDKKILKVKFLNGGEYKYSEVPKDVYEDLLNADSKGSFFYRNIRGTYSYSKVN